MDPTGTTSYTWDFENRLTSVTLSAGGTITFKYDPFGRRIYKSTISGISVFVYDGDNLIEETNAAGAVVARYTQGPNIDEPLAVLGWGAATFYNADGLGSVTSMTNAAGALAQTYAFDSFGKQTASSGSLENSFRYTAREFDPETSLYYYRARYFDPNAGRFLTEDPLRFKAGANFYSYVGNNPTRYKDPLGLLRDCDQEQIDYFRKCWGSPCPWPFGRSSNPKVRRWSRYAYCQAKCLAEYMECVAENEGKKVIDACRENPAVCVAIGVAVGIIIPQPEAGAVLGPVVARAW